MANRVWYYCIVIIFVLCACAHSNSRENNVENMIAQNGHNKKSSQSNLRQEEMNKNILEQENKDLKEKVAQLKQEKQSLLGKLGSCQDESIRYLGENNALLAQIASLKGADQQKKETEKKLQKGYNYMLSFLEKERLEGNILIIKESEDIKIIISQSAIFPTEKSAWLTPKGKKLIKRITQGLKVIDPNMIQIAGHTDDTPIPKDIRETYPNNWHLGMARALAVLEVFDAQGIQKDKLYAVSYGDTKPMMEDSSPENKAMNRRVEIVIMP